MQILGRKNRSPSTHRNRQAVRLLGLGLETALARENVQETVGAVAAYYGGEIVSNVAGVLDLAVFAGGGADDLGRTGPLFGEDKLDGSAATAEEKFQRFVAVHRDFARADDNDVVVDGRHGEVIGFLEKP